MGNFEKLGVLVIIILAVVIMIILIGGGPQAALEPEHERARSELIKGTDRADDRTETVVHRDPPDTPDIDPPDRRDWPDPPGVDGCGEGAEADNRTEERDDPPALVDLTHTVQRGDNPYNLAEKYYGRGNGKLYRKILDANAGVTASNLSIGMDLVIPHPDKVLGNGASSGGGGTASTPVQGGNRYVVQKGDSLWKIAKKTLGNGSAYKRIQEANRDVLAGGTDVSPGMELLIPR